MRMKRTVFMSQNEVENVICKMATILYRPHCISRTRDAAHSIHVSRVRPKLPMLVQRSPVETFENIIVCVLMY